MSDFASRLRSLRAEKNISQAELGKLLNVAPSTVGYWESGNGSTSAAIAAHLAVFFGVSVDYLLGKSDYRKIEIPETDIINELKVLFRTQLKGIPPEGQKEVAEYIKLQMLKYGKK